MRLRFYVFLNKIPMSIFEELMVRQNARTTKTAENS